MVPIPKDPGDGLMKVAVVGAGKMGLPLACQFARKGAHVVACDKNPAVVDAINKGECPIDEPGIPEILKEVFDAGRLTASADTAKAVADRDVVVIIVPAMLTKTKEIDFSILEAASRDVAKGLRKGTMVCYETTVSVGGTRERLRPVLETGGLVAGTDFDLVFSPERVKSLKVLEHLESNPKIVGGLDDKAAKRAAEFYATYLGAPVTNLKTLEASELAKLAGMLYRDVNIALVNELARYAEAEGIDFAPVIEAANTDGESALLKPGIGVGGHCTPVYPYFLTRRARHFGVPSTLAERARLVNDGQAAHLVKRLSCELGGLKGEIVTILGLAFRPEVKEHAYSSAFLIRDAIEAEGATAVLFDPLYSDSELQALGFTPGSLDRPGDALVLNTAHAVFQKLDFASLAKKGVKGVVDGRNLWDANAIRKAGPAYVGVGRPSALGDDASPKSPVAKAVLSGE